MQRTNVTPKQKRHFKTVTTLMKEGKTLTEATKTAGISKGYFNVIRWRLKGQKRTITPHPKTTTAKSTKTRTTDMISLPTFIVNLIDSEQLSNETKLAVIRDMFTSETK